MLKDVDAIATIAVKNLEAATGFYEDVLGFKRDPNSMPGVVIYRSGRSNLQVYESRYAGTNQATAATWAVSDVDEEVRALKAKGVVFEHYDFPDTTRQGDVHVSGGTRVAWFKDPDGNILSIVSR